MEKLNYPQFWLLIFAWFIADLATPLMIRLAHRIGAVDKPHSYKTHLSAVPFLGGVCIYLAFSIAVFSILRVESFEKNERLFAIVVGGGFLVILGCIDDFKPISAVFKLIVLAFLTYGLSHFGIRIGIFHNEYLNMALTLLWIAGVTSAMNSLDNMDGVSTGISAIAAFFTFTIAWYSHPPQTPVSYFAIALLGACLGFLRYNFKPARIFLGDNGSLLLGFLVASMMVLTGWSKQDLFKALVTPCAILAVPLYDITLTTILRYKNKVVKNFVEAIVYCGRDHLSHRFVALGFSQRETVLILYLCGVLSGGAAVLIDREDVGPVFYVPIVVIAVIVLVALGIFLDKAKVYEHDKEAKEKTEKD